MKKLLFLFVTICFSQTLLLSQTPTITSFAPVATTIGSNVVITGTNFSSTPANNIVYFGATTATVTLASPTSITVTVPVGAIYSAISVTVNNKIAYSRQQFITTFSYCGSPEINSNSWLSQVNFFSGKSSHGGMSIGDIDGDGKPDLVVIGYTIGNDSIFIYRNTSTTGVINASSFANKVGFKTNNLNLLVNDQLQLVDLDVDGKLDIIIGFLPTFGFKEVVIYRNTSSVGVINLSSIAAPVFLNNPTSGNTIKLATGDVDGDGRPDIVTSRGSDSLYVTRNISTPGSISIGSFAPPVKFLISSAIPFDDVAVSDFDADGLADAVISTGAGILISRSTSTVGSISFAAPVSFSGSSSQTEVFLTDVDVDGKVDVAQNTFFNTTNIYKNNCTPGVINSGSFAAPISFPGKAKNFADLDGDGRPDMAGAGSVYRNQSSVGVINASSFGAAISLPGSMVTDGAIGDLDGDGMPDLAFYNNIGTSIAVERRTIALSVPAPDICMVTVDSTSTNNEIFWDKTLYPTLDSMIIYREVTSNIYKQIGAVYKTALSMFSDTTRSVGPANGNPNVGTYRYKIRMRDNCGNYSPMSYWHNTVFFINSSGTFFWNQYLIETSSSPNNPMTQFDLVRDDFAPTGNYNNVGTVAGTQTTLADPFYVAYQATADWRVFAYGLNCTPTQRLGDVNQINVVSKSRSNIKNNRVSGINNLDYANNILLFPQPATNEVKIQFSNLESKVAFELYNTIGELVHKQNAQNCSGVILNIQNLNSGVYLLVITTNKEKVVKKLVKD